MSTAELQTEAASRHEPFSDEWIEERLFQEEGKVRMYLKFCGVRARDLDDVLQEVLMTAWVNIDSLKDPQAFSAWIQVIAKRKAMRHRDNVLLYWIRNYPLSFLEEDLEESGSAVPEELIYREMKKFTDTELYDLVMELGYPAANILILHYVYEEQFEEIARTLKMPVGTVRSHASRGRKKLKKRIEERGNCADEA